jgi:hypothetical protein
VSGTPALRASHAFADLQRALRPRAPAESCELCGRTIDPRHAHLVDPAASAIVCVCEACAILLGHSGVKYRRVPDQPRGLPGVALTDAQWQTLAIPIGLAFCLRQTSPDRLTAFYPSPAGATEAPLGPDAWADIVAANGPLAALSPDVEALLINRLGVERGVRPEYFAAPIDRCYALVGLVRTHWRGLGGGERVWREVADFFAALRDECGLHREAIRA